MTTFITTIPITNTVDFFNPVYTGLPKRYDVCRCFELPRPCGGDDSDAYEIGRWTTEARVLASVDDIRSVDLTAGKAFCFLSSVVLVTERGFIVEYGRLGCHLSDDVVLLTETDVDDERVKSVCFGYNSAHGNDRRYVLPVVAGGEVPDLDQGVLLLLDPSAAFVERVMASTVLPVVVVSFSLTRELLVDDSWMSRCLALPAPLPCDALVAGHGLEPVLVDTDGTALLGGLSDMTLCGPDDDEVQFEAVYEYVDVLDDLIDLSWFETSAAPAVETTDVTAMLARELKGDVFPDGCCFYLFFRKQKWAEIALLARGRCYLDRELYEILDAPTDWFADLRLKVVKSQAVKLFHVVQDDDGWPAVDLWRTLWSVVDRVVTVDPLVLEFFDAWVLTVGRSDGDWRCFVDVDPVDLADYPDVVTPFDLCHILRVNGYALRDNCVHYHRYMVCDCELASISCTGTALLRLLERFGDRGRSIIATQDTRELIEDAPLTGYVLDGRDSSLWIEPSYRAVVAREYSQIRSVFDLVQIALEFSEHALLPFVYVSVDDETIRVVEEPLVDTYMLRLRDFVDAIDNPRARAEYCVDDYSAFDSASSVTFDMVVRGTFNPRASVEPSWSVLQTVQQREYTSPYSSVFQAVRQRLLSTIGSDSPSDSRSVERDLRSALGVMLNDDSVVVIDEQ